MPVSYRVSRRVNGGDWKLLDQVASSTFIDSTAPPGGVSDYKAAAVDPEGRAGFASSPVSVGVPAILPAETEDAQGPPAPADLAAPLVPARPTRPCPADAPSPA